MIGARLRLDRRALFAVSAAVYPTIALAAGNALETSLVDLAIVGGLFAVLGLVLYIVTVMVIPTTIPRRVTSLITLVIAAWVFDAEMVADRAASIALRSRDAMILLTIFAICLVVWLLRTRLLLRRVTQATAIFMVLLPVYSGARFIIERARINRALRASPFFHHIVQPLPIPTRHAWAPRPDIYIFILDNYANGRVLAERYDFDNSSFVDSLKALGFTVPRESRSNYGWTPLSLASMLSGEHVTALENDSVGRSASWDILYNAIRRSPVLAAFAHAGYHVYLVPSAYFPGTRDTEVGELYLPRNSRSARARVARLGLARAAWQASTPGRLGGKMGWYLAPASVSLAPFTGVAELANRPGPKVVLVHSLITHDPYQFQADCTLRSRESHDESAYTDQVQCTNRQMLWAMGALRLADSKPTVLILADHGSASHGLPTLEAAERIDSARARERFGAFRAQLLPSGLAIADSSTPVNVMRQVAGEALGISLPMLIDSSYWSSFNPPYHYVAVDSLIRRTPAQ